MKRHIELKKSSLDEIKEGGFSDLFEIIRIAYAVTEEPMFGHGYIRIQKEELKEIIRQEQLLHIESDGKIVGCIRHYFVEQKVYSFGLLGVDRSCLNQGYASQLVEAVEDIARKKRCTGIRIEILRPSEFELEDKKLISNWYQRIGYELTHSLPMDDVIPGKSSIVPLTFDFYYKPLLE